MIDACVGIKFAYAQDEIRAKSLSEEYDIPLQKIYQMPVAGEGVVPYITSRYLYDFFQIPYEKLFLRIWGPSVIGLRRLG